MIAQKISKSAGMLFKLSKYLPTEIIKTLYYSLINPFLLYGIEVWLSILTILNTSFNTHTTEYFKNPKNLKLTGVHEYQISKHMFKCLNLNANILSRHSDIHNYPTRNNNKFIAPKCNMRKSEISINFKSIKV